MGTWGAGNFDSDTAGDFFDGYGGILDEILRPIVYGLNQHLWHDEQPYESGDVLAAVDALTVIGAHVWLPYGLTEAIVEKWRELYLKLLDTNPARPEPEYKGLRRNVVDECFDRLIAVIRADAKPTANV
jgi:hypothetical protein